MALLLLLVYCQVSSQVSQVGGCSFYYLFRNWSEVRGDCYGHTGATLVGACNSGYVVAGAEYDSFGMILDSNYRILGLDLVGV